ncbi:glycosyltransferase 87 family protein [Fulvivirgaceae bacterium BMA12]|uniref:Glycosyltransferase 87 family protein n=1 Tax=Agaribacillus aureus TaxID=3051825 RepID=A0ABT8L6M5_9BACT|nr:glycosyltransferase 87 family protein [Fulvivirgaceae bacterium BMA12]
MSNPFKNTNSYLSYPVLIISFLGYVYLAYFLERTATPELMITYTILFVSYIVLLFIPKVSQNVDLFSNISLLIRCSLLFSLPNLSDDFYRFIWDGRLLNEGINPFTHLPSYYLDHPTLAPPGIDEDLYLKLNSQDYFTIYPPVNQFLFWLATYLSPQSILGSVIVIRVAILLAEVGTIAIIRKLLAIYRLPPKNVLIYALNPLAILELTGNLHFEGLVIFFVLGAVYLLHQKKLLYAAVSFALAIGTKLIPVIFLPVLFSRLSVKKTIIFYVITGVVTLLLFLPLLNAEFVEGISSSFSLYFKKFEFNAGVYYLLRAYGYHLEGYNIIGMAGGFLALATFVIIIHYAFYESVTRHHILLFTFLWILMIYLSLTTTLHPWYIIPLVAYCLFTNYRFPIIWSLLIFLTYVNYSTLGFKENLHIVTVEYVILLAFLWWELGGNSRKKLSF